jgi:hypothetical protein
LTKDQADSLGLKWTKFYDSTKEAARHKELLLLQESGLISALQWQPRWPIVVNGVKVCVYIADACYVEGGQVVVEDAKGVRTPVYRLKAKLMRAVHGVTIREA